MCGTTLVDTHVIFIIFSVIYLYYLDTLILNATQFFFNSTAKNIINIMIYKLYKKCYFIIKVSVDFNLHCDLTPCVNDISIVVEILYIIVKLDFFKTFVIFFLKFHTG